MSDDLKPCPFCDGEAEIVDAVEAGDQAKVVCCKKCMASSKVIFALMDDVTFDLVSAWNTRAPRIEELEASKNEALNQLDSALYSVSVLEKRVNSLMAENADLKLKLAKAVKGLQSLIIEYDKVDLAYDEPKSMTAVYGVALDTLAELTGGKDAY